jgi:hypothetical protein
MRRISKTIAMSIVLCGFASLALAQTGSIQSKKLPTSFLKKVSPRTAHSADPSFTAGRVKYLPDGTKITSVKSLATSGLPGVDSVANWSDQFTEPGFDFFGNPQSVWPYTIVGTPPESGQTTTFRAPIIPVTVDLLGPDGTVAVFDGHPLTFAPTPTIINAIVKSPVFQPWFYTTGAGQFNDQAMRSEFSDKVHGNWHNYLAPVVKTGRRMQIPWGFWFFFTDANNVPIGAEVDGDVFSTLFFPETLPVDSSTPIGAAEVSHDITTKDISTFAFNNVFLYEGGDPNNCCVLGFHTYDFEPGNGENGIQEHRYVLNFSSWLPPQFFSFGFEDITPLAHEMAETFNDPFVNNETPWYESIDPFLGSGLCQDNLETGDAIEVLTSNPVFAVSMNGRTYHPQNIPLFNWFAFQSPSLAHLGAYSFPDETTLTALSPGNLLPGCVPGP